MEKLKVDATNAAANTVVGRYLCFEKGDWKKGLPMLARGSDANLKQLAKTEIGVPTNDDDMTRLADGWWDVSDNEADPARVELICHAANLYKSALPHADGLRRTVLETRIADATSVREKRLAKAVGNNARIVHLLWLIDPAKDTLEGKFAANNGQLVTIGQGGHRIEIPYRPPQEYDFRIEFARLSTKGPVVQILSRDRVDFIWVMQDNCLFHYLKGGDDFSN